MEGSKCNKLKDPFNKVKVQHSDNIIINIQHIEQSSYINELPGFVNEHCNSSYNKCELCWNCCHSFTTMSKGVPMKYINNTFYIYGYFCSYNCAARYIFDTFSDKQKWDIYSLLNLYYNMSNNINSGKVPLAPHKLILNKFGGTMDIDEYRSNNLAYELVLPPIIPIDHTFKHINDNMVKSTDNKSHYKLYRKKSMNHNIYETMNLTSNETGS
jgi:hypothetical protein